MSICNGLFDTVQIIGIPVAVFIDALGLFPPLLCADLLIREPEIKTRDRLPVISCVLEHQANQLRILILRNGMNHLCKITTIRKVDAVEPVNA